MQNPPNQSLFRGFSASDRNQLEHSFLTQLFKIFSLLSLSTVSSNAENRVILLHFTASLLGKSDFEQRIHNPIPYYSKCFTFTILVQVVS